MTHSTLAAAAAALQAAVASHEGGGGEARTLSLTPVLFDERGEPASYCTSCGRRFLEAELFCPRDGRPRAELRATSGDE